MLRRFIDFHYVKAWGLSSPKIDNGAGAWLSLPRRNLAPSARLVCGYEPLREVTMLTTVLIIILILILLGAFPSWPYSRGWGYGPSGVVGLILVILLILLLLGKI